MREPTRRASFAVLSAVIFMTLVSLFVIGSYTARLADVHGDNGAVFYAYLYSHTGEFSRDVFGAPGLHWLWGSICFWLPVLAAKHVGLNPQIPDLLFYFLQILTLGLSIFWLSWVASRSWVTAFTSMALAIVLEPWSWNFAAYPSTLGVPLYTTLAQGLATVAGTALLTRRWALAWFLALATAAVHPVVACYLMAMLAVWAVLNRGAWQIWLKPQAVASLLVLSVMCGMPLLLPYGFTEARLSPSEQWESISKHMHSVPWGNYPPVFHDLAAKTVAFLLILAGCWQRLQALPIDQRRFLLAAGIGTFLLSIIQIAGIELRLANVALTMGLRAFSNFILFAWPFAFAIIFDRNTIRNFPACFALLLATIVWARMGSGIPVFQILLCAVAIGWPHSQPHGSRTIVMIILALCPLLLIAGHKADWGFFHAARELSASFYLIALISAAVVAYVSTIARVTEPLKVIAAFTLIVAALVASREIGLPTRQPAATDSTLR